MKHYIGITVQHKKEVIVKVFAASSGVTQMLDLQSIRTTVIILTISEKLKSTYHR